MSREKWVFFEKILGKLFASNQFGHLEEICVGVFKKSALFALGGAAYVGVELLWRGRSHGSMSLAGGTAFLLLGQLGKRKISLPVRALAGSAVITAVELAAGLVFNRDHGIWDYRQMPLHFQGQICLPYSLLWMPLSLGAMALYNHLNRP